MIVYPRLKGLMEASLPALWAALLTQDPRTVQDPLTVELVSSAYSRPEARTSGGARPQINFLGIPAGATIAAIGMFDAPVNGNLRFIYVLDEPYQFGKGGSISIPGGTLDLLVEP